MERLARDRTGEVPGALWHPAIGPIDLVWGEEGSGRSTGFGLAKLIRRHPEVVARLPEILPSLPVTRRPEQTGNNRWVLENNRYRAVIAPDFLGRTKRWLVTAFVKRTPEGPDISPRTSLPDGGSTGAGDAADIGDRRRIVDPEGQG